jgi:hypothetical protein
MELPRIYSDCTNYALEITVKFVCEFRTGFFLVIPKNASEIALY